MARYIDADRMREDWLENGENEYVYDTNAVLQSIDEQPTVDVTEVVRCKDCVSHTHCFVEDHYNFVGIENPFCCVGKKVQNDL